MARINRELVALTAEAQINPADNRFRIRSVSVNSKWPLTAKAVNPLLANVFGHRRAVCVVIQDLHAFVLPPPISDEPTEHEFAFVRVVRDSDFEVLCWAVILTARHVEAINRFNCSVSENGVIADNPEVLQPDVAVVRIQFVPTGWEVDDRIAVDYLL
ncbi:hypothetical protein ACFFQF_23755 [Haladaptatus pallidirubidus]|uniref:hypothetical protein n=1 Tax=Haladaptatus pallidirubidus TaxID=1008152 RepID=UPI0035EACF45